MRINALLHRDSSGNRPGDVPVRVSGDEVLRWYAHRVRHVERFRDGLDCLEAEYVRVHGFFVVRDPAHRDLTMRIGHFADRPPDSLPHMQIDRRLAADRNGLDVNIECQVALGRTVGTRRLPRHEQDGICPIAVAVRVTPGESRVAARNNKRRTGQRNAHYVAGRSVGRDQTGLVVDIRHADTEMHIVGDECRTRCGQVA